MIWAGFILPTLTANYAFHGRTLKLIAIDLANWLIGLLITGAILGWWGVRVIAPSRFDPSFGAQAFQLLASVAVPHLLLSRWLERRLAVACCAEDQTAAP